MKLVPIVQEVFAKINVVAVGPLPITSSVKKYLITAMCLASKYTDDVAVSDFTSMSVVDALGASTDAFGDFQSHGVSEGNSTRSRNFLHEGINDRIL
ncbi:hypothetical protein AVEN_100006-1 [Araneus ventricosus]|uniref:Uncharacterized protein n=1 Tax=Araneus ventricosus TaxID=182803 RepID=A0A4Y2WDR5_ARAVE|nr:hypothetical protein AVEN_100006-1 [Araneus ventricosus]